MIFIEANAMELEDVPLATAHQLQQVLTDLDIISTSHVTTPQFVDPNLLSSKDPLE
jgi:hypothetical protein